VQGCSARAASGANQRPRVVVPHPPPRVCLTCAFKLIKPARGISESNEFDSTAFLAGRGHQNLAGQRVSVRVRASSRHRLRWPGRTYALQGARFFWHSRAASESVSLRTREGCQGQYPILAGMEPVRTLSPTRVRRSGSTGRSENNAMNRELLTESAWRARAEGRIPRWRRS